MAEGFHTDWHNNKRPGIKFRYIPAQRQRGGKTDKDNRGRTPAKRAGQEQRVSLENLLVVQHNKLLLVRGGEWK